MDTYYPKGLNFEFTSQTIAVKPDKFKKNFDFEYFPSLPRVHRFSTKYDQKDILTVIAMCRSVKELKLRGKTKTQIIRLLTCLQANLPQITQSTNVDDRASLHRILSRYLFPKLRELKKPEQKP